MEDFPARDPLLFALACFTAVVCIKLLRRGVESGYGVPATWRFHRGLFMWSTKEALYLLFIVVPAATAGGFLFRVFWMELWERLTGLIFGS